MWCLLFCFTVVEFPRYTEVKDNKSTPLFALSRKWGLHGLTQESAWAKWIPPTFGCDLLFHTHLTLNLLPSPTILQMVAIWLANNWASEECEFLHAMRILRFSSAGGSRFETKDGKVDVIRGWAVAFIQTVWVEDLSLDVQGAGGLRRVRSRTRRVPGAALWFL